MTVPVGTIVVGAGVSGLAYAHARGADADLVVLEAAGHAGGLVRTTEVEGLRYEWGPEALQDNAPETLALMDELGLAPVAAAPEAQKRFVMHEGELIALPAGPGDFMKSKLLSLPGKLRALTEPMRKSDRALDGSVADFVRHRLGKQVLERLVDPFVTGIYAGDPELIAVRSAFPMLVEMVSEHGSLMGGLKARAKARREAGEEKGGMPGLMTVAGGLGGLVGAMADTLGDRLHLDCAVTSIEKDASGWTVQTGHGAFRAERLVVSLNVTAAARLMQQPLPELGEALSNMTTESVVSISHAWKREDVAHPLDGFGYLIPGGEQRSHLGTLFSSTIEPTCAPDGMVLMRTLLGGARNPRLIDWPDEELLGVLRDDVGPVLGFSGDPQWAVVVRNRAALPRYDLAQPARQDRIDALLDATPGLHLLGNHRRGISCNNLIEASRALAREHAGGAAAT
ncbi:MAG: protoporphyrinogen oxidase [Planctomycetota bacterium]|jgi:oxygen-dependent protoporphyrinogen oxidase